MGRARCRPSIAIKAAGSYGHFKKDEIDRFRKTIVDYSSLERSGLRNLHGLIFDYEHPGAKRIHGLGWEHVVRHGTHLLDEFERTGVYSLATRFNPFEILLSRKKYNLDEDDHSNLLATLLNPRGSHCLGLIGLRVFLEIVAGRCPDPLMRHKVRSLLSESVPASINVRTRVRKSQSVIDICVEARDCYILVENKLSGGIETITDSKAQTEREWEDWVQAETDKQKVFVFISPDMKPATQEGFVVLGRGDMEKYFRSLAVEASDSSVAAFLDFYSEFYYKHI